MTLSPVQAPTVQDVLVRLIDRQYTRAAGAVIQAITQGSSSGLVAKRLQELDAEAARLAGEAKRLTPDNPVVRALLADFETVMRANGALVSSAAGPVQETGIIAAGPITRQLALPGFTDDMLAALGVAWNVPDPDAVAQVVRYTDSVAWQERIAAYSAGGVEAAQQTALRGMVLGWSPLRTAREVRRVVEGLPPYQANQMLRTLQLTAMRDAQRLHRVANAGILEYQIRVAALDDQTCMACVALHGTRLPIEERINDHHSGRCGSVTKVAFLPAPIIQSGPDWFATRTEAQQRAMMGGAAFAAWQDGAITLPDFVQSYDDPVFGPMIREASLKGMIGARAQEFYH
jgi:hypothetical protein